MKLFLRPIDTFYFRDHNDLTSGEDSSASTIFPPRPGTIYGALRSAYIHHFTSFHEFGKGSASEQVSNWMGNPEKVGNFKIKGVFLSENRNPIFPLPLDFQVVKQEERLQAFPLQLMENTESQESDGETFRLMATKDGKSESSEGKFIIEHDLKNIILGKETAISPYPASQWVQQENKLGIAHSWRTKQSIDNMLYNIRKMHFTKPTTEFVVLTNTGESPSFASPGSGSEGISYLRLGGGNRPWALAEVKEEYNLLNESQKAELIEAIQKSQRAKIILLTPAIWENGYLPNYEADTKDFPKRKYIKISPTLKVEYVAASLGRPLVAGGWDIQQQRPKPRMNAVPAGSVLYVKVNSEDAEEFVETMLWGTLTDYLSHEGYGLTVPAVY